MTAAANMREPLSRRTGDRVRRESRPKGGCESTWWSPMVRRDVGRILQAAERYDLAGKKKGARCGPIGGNGVRVLRELLRLVDFATGRLEPAIETLMARLRLSKTAVVRALACLKAEGFVSWLRRFVPTGNAGRRGPQVQQATNAYRVELPAKAARLIVRGPEPEDFETARAGRAAELRQMAEQEVVGTPLGKALDRLGRAVQSASPLTGQNPA